MKRLNKCERWYCFLEVIFDGRRLGEMPMNHTEFGLFTELIPAVEDDRMDELDRFVAELWKNPPRLVE